MSAEMIFKFVCGAVSVIMMIYYLRREKKVFSVLFGALTGIAALTIVNKYGGMLDIEIPLNLFNVGGSAVLGVPFVICLVILNTFSL